MIKNYLRSGFRSLSKNKLSASINIVTLGLAIGCSLVVFEFIEWGTHMDNFHHKLKNLFVIERITRQNGDDVLWGDSPSPMGPMLKNDFAQVRNFARVNYQNVVIKKGDDIFRETASFADSSLYQMFDFPIKWGNKSAFNDIHGIVLTEELSEKLFGKMNPLGQQVQMLFDVKGQTKTENLTVRGVFDKKPDEASWYFSALIPYEKQYALGLEAPGDWTGTSGITFLEADNEAALNPLKTRIKKYEKLYNAANPYNPVAGFNFQPLDLMSFHAYHVNNRQFIMTDIKPFIMVLIIAIATLLLVYFNYMNIAIASTLTRLKEISFRKVMGGSRMQIIVQFLVENVMVCAAGVMVGLLLAKFLFLPFFSEIISIPIGAELFFRPLTWVALVGLILLSAMGGAFYPALYVSSFNPIHILRGTGKISGRSRFRKSLLAVQFFLTFLTMSVAMTFIREPQKLKARPWGYDPSHTVVVNMDKSASYEAFRDELKGVRGLVSVTGSVQSLGEYSAQIKMKADGGLEQGVQLIEALPGFATQLGIPIIAGRDLSPDRQSDKTEGVLVNESLVKKMGWTSAIGKKIEYKKQSYWVAGELRDFHFENFQVPVGPLVIMGCREKDINSVYIKTSSAGLTAPHHAVETIWKKLFPDLPFEYHYQEDVFDNYFSAFGKIGQVLGAAAIILMIICVSGIFGLASVLLGRKMKEISVRKVLGAGLRDLAIIITREFLWALGTAVLLGIPVAWWLASSLFMQFLSDSAISVIPFILTAAVLLAATLMSLSWHIWSAQNSDPKKFLGSE